MPHYKDGTEAKVGDQVIGKLFNTDGIRAGTIISITPGSESCNAQVQFTEAAMYGSSDKVPRMALCAGGALVPPRDVQGVNHGTEGPVFQLFTCVDYCDVSGLTRADRVGPPGAREVGSTDRERNLPDADCG